MEMDQDIKKNVIERVRSAIFEIKEKYDSTNKFPIDVRLDLLNKLVEIENE